MADPRLSLGGLAVLAAACGGGTSAPAPAARATPPARSAAPGAPADVFRDVAWGRLVDAGARIELPLPERPAWTAQHRDGWAVATHVRSQTTLWARAWRAEGVVNRRGCEAEARRATVGLPEPPSVEPIAEGRVRRPPGYDTEWRLVVKEQGDGADGLLLAYGANLRRCMAVLVETHTEGPYASRRAIERLMLFAEAVVPEFVVRDIEDRVRSPVDG